MILGKKILTRGGNSHSLSFSNGPYVDTTANSNTSGFSFSAWYKYDSSFYNSTYMGLATSTNATGGGFRFLFNRQVNGQNYSFQIFKNGTYNPLIESGQYNMDIWENIVWTYDGADAFLYKNGAQVGSGSGAMDADDGSIKIGSYYADGSEDYHNMLGNIDQVKLYHRVLSQNEAIKLYKGVSISRAGLVGEWKMNKGSGDTAYDSSGNGNHGTLVDGPTWSTDTPTYGG